MAHAIETCVHCGFCLAACPTYKELGQEMDSPRGRIVLMKEVLEGKLTWADAQPHVMGIFDRRLVASLSLGSKFWPLAAARIASMTVWSGSMWDMSQLYPMCDQLGTPTQPFVEQWRRSFRRTQGHHRSDLECRARERSENRFVRLPCDKHRTSGERFEDGRRRRSSDLGDQGKWSG